jgi:hypothetical protein
VVMEDNSLVSHVSKEFFVEFSKHSWILLNLGRAAPLPSYWSLLIISCEDSE